MKSQGWALQSELVFKKRREDFTSLLHVDRGLTAGKGWWTLFLGTAFWQCIKVNDSSIPSRVKKLDSDFLARVQYCSIFCLLSALLTYM